MVAFKLQLQVRDARHFRREAEAEFHNDRGDDGELHGDLLQVDEVLLFLLFAGSCDC